MLRDCPQLRSLDGRTVGRLRPCHVMAATLHVLILVPLCTQIHRVTPVLADSHFSINSISMICPAAGRQPRAPQTARVATPSSQAAAAQPAMQQAAPFTPTRIIRPEVVDAPSSVVMSNLNWMGDTTSSTSDVRFGAHRGAVTLDTAEPSSTVATPMRGGRKDSLQEGNNSWEARLMSRIAQFRRYPDDARRHHEQGVVYLWFRMDRAGHVLAARIDKSSGSAALDQEALATLHRAQPLPSAPANRPAIFEMELPIEFYLLRPSI